MIRMVSAFQSNKTYLVTGGCGFIGRALVRKLAGRGHRVIVLDDQSSGSASLLPVSPNIEFIQGSVTDLKDVEAACHDVDEAFHLAGIVGMRLAKANADRTFSVSSDGTANLLRVLGDRPATLFSSSAVYGVELRNVTAESDSVGAAEAFAYDGGKLGYASGKLEMERIAAEVDPKGERILIIRPFNVVGPGQTGRYGMVIPTFLESARHGLPIRVHGDGTQTRCFGHVDVAVNCVMQLHERFAARTLRSNIYNVGCDRPTRIIDLAELVRDLRGSLSPIVHIPYEDDFPGARDCAHRVPDLRRLTAELGPVSWPGIDAIVSELVVLS